MSAPARVCEASIAGHCLAAALEQGVCAVDRGECVHGWPEPAPPPVPADGPSIREAAHDDAAHWADKYAGEGS